MMHQILSEFLGTALMVVFGVGVNAAVTLNKSKYQGQGELFAISTWGFGITVALFIFGNVSLNPAMALAQALLNNISWLEFVLYSIAEILGALAGSLIIYIMYKDQFDASTDLDAVKVRTIFSTTPAVRDLPRNFFVEFFCTFIFLVSILVMVEVHTPGMAALAIGFLVWAIGMALGGTTGFAMNQARDWGPRLAYMLVPIKNKTKFDWQYGLIVPGIAPFFGAISAVLFYSYFI